MAFCGNDVKSKRLCYIKNFFIVKFVRQIFNCINAKTYDMSFSLYSTTKWEFQDAVTIRRVRRHVLMNKKCVQVWVLNQEE